MPSRFAALSLNDLVTGVPTVVWKSRLVGVAAMVGVVVEVPDKETVTC